MTVKDFRMIYGSGCYLNFGRDCMKGWLIEKQLLIQADEQLSEYDNAEIISMYTLDDTNLGAVLAIVID